MKNIETIICETEKSLAAATASINSLRAAIAATSKTQLPTALRTDSIARAAHEVLAEIDAATHTKGYKYIVDAIVIALTAPDAWEIGITKYVYPTIARKYNTRATAVERDMRTTITMILRHPDSRRPEIARKIGLTTDRRFTNRRFVTSIAGYITDHYNLS